MNAHEQKRRRRYLWVAGGVILALGGAFAVQQRAGARKQFDASLIVPVVRKDLQIEVIETGKVQPRERVELKSKVAGQVEALLVDEGQVIKPGQLLLKLDPTDFKRDVARAEAEVARAKAEIAQSKNALDFAMLNLERRKKGLETRGVAQADVDVAQSEVRAKAVALQTAQATLAGLNVALAAAEDRLRYTEIVAPLAGTVIERGVRVGEVVTPGVQATFEGKALLTIGDLSTLIVKTDLNQIDVAKVQLGQKVNLTLDALPDRTYTATITKVAPAAITPKGKEIDVFPVEATLDTTDTAIKPGMTADVRIQISTKPRVLSLPIEAVSKEHGESFAMRIHKKPNGDQDTERVVVRVGVRNDREVEIQSGLADGDLVLIKPPSASDNEFKM